MDANESGFLKCSCAHCGGHLEFERAYLGLKVPCPHCGQETTLTLSVMMAAVPPPPPVAEAAPPPAPLPTPPPAPTPKTGPAPAHGENWPRYRKGEEVRAGDRVRHKGTAAKVVFVTDGDRCEYLPGYDEYRGQDEGVVICDDDGDATSLHGENLGLELIHRRR